jgi:hypothetical protein
MRQYGSTFPQNFDEWARLAATDPPSFETQRSLVIEQAILEAPAHKQQRLRCLQWKLDQIRATSRTPMVACLRMHRLLWEAVAGETGLLACLCRAAEPDRPRATGRHTATAQVIPLARRR